MSQEGVGPAGKPRANALKLLSQQHLKEVVRIQG
jgi:hypothetical protein